MEKENHPQLEDLSEIRNIMERSSRFISLSGLSGVAAGCCALAGAFATYLYWDRRIYPYADMVFTAEGNIRTQYLLTLLGIAAAVLVAALFFGILFTTRKARKQGVPIWGQTSRRLLINLAIPLATGGAFVFILVYHQVTFLAAPSTLIFYGLGLLNASKYTLNDIRYLGISEILIGLVSCIFTGYALIFWALGFGVLHIVYGITLYRKYES